MRSETTTRASTSVPDPADPPLWGGAASWVREWSLRIQRYSRVRVTCPIVEVHESRRPEVKWVTRLVALRADGRAAAAAAHRGEPRRAEHGGQVVSKEAVSPDAGGCTPRSLPRPRRPWSPASPP